MAAPSIPDLAAELRVQRHSIKRVEQDIDEMAASVARAEAVVQRVEHAMVEIKHAVSAVPALQAAVADLNLERAKQAGRTAWAQVWASLATGIFTAVMTLIGVYLVSKSASDEPPPIAAPRLTESEREELRLLEKRDGYRLGQQPPTGP
jgi:hypothetical protein